MRHPPDCNSCIAVGGSGRRSAGRVGMLRAITERMGIRDHRELVCWQFAESARRQIFEVATGSAFEQYRWRREQLLRASSSACSNMAEGFARFNPHDFARFLTMAKGSLVEVRQHLATATSLKLLSETEQQAIESSIGRSIGAATKLIVYLKKSRF